MKESFDFLGFRFYLGRTLKGSTIPKVKTCGKRYRSKLNKVKDWAQQIRSKKPWGEIWKTFCAKLRGHVQYYGVSFNCKSVGNFMREAEKILFKNRRSQRKSFDWSKFQLFKMKNPLPQVKVRHKLF
jgi:RNA-directed DNA polymerase